MPSTARFFDQWPSLAAHLAGVLARASVAFYLNPPMQEQPQRCFWLKWHAAATLHEWDYYAEVDFDRRRRTERLLYAAASKRVDTALVRCDPHVFGECAPLVDEGFRFALQCASQSIPVASPRREERLRDMLFSTDMPSPARRLLWNGVTGAMAALTLGEIQHRGLRWDAPACAAATIAWHTGQYSLLRLLVSLEVLDVTTDVVSKEDRLDVAAVDRQARLAWRGMMISLEKARAAWFPHYPAETRERTT